MIKRERVAVTTTGSAGSATGSATTRHIMQGRVVRVDVDYHASAPATTDLTISGANDLISTNVVSLPNNNTDTQLFPAVQVTDNAGTGVTYDGTNEIYDYYPVSDQLTVSLAQCDALTDAVVVHIYYKE